MTEKKVNMFEKAHDDRRQRFVEENDHVAREIVALPDEDTDDEISKSNSNFLLKENRKKIMFSTRLDSNIDSFINGLHAITGATKTDIVNEFLTYAIMNQDDLVEIRKQNGKVQSLFEKFINS